MLLFLCVFLGASVLIASQNEAAHIYFEKKMLQLFPSAERAYTYGQNHFSSSRGAYNAEATEYFFIRTSILDPEHPYVLHELARVAFLKSNFSEALRLITTQIEKHGDTISSSFYVKGLIEGYMGRYDDAAKSYELFLKYQPKNWAALNDYAWVLLKAERFEEAHEAVEQGLKNFPDNPWLLNSGAIALGEMGDTKRALAEARAALSAFEKIGEKDWLIAYPGNDPKTAVDGLATFKKALLDNIHTLETRVAEDEVE